MVTQVLKKRKPVIGVQVDEDLREKIRAYAHDNRMTESGAMRFMVVDFLRRNVNLSNVEGEQDQSFIHELHNVAG
jgi:hypothetical protein